MPERGATEHTQLCVALNNGQAESLSKRQSDQSTEPTVERKVCMRQAEEKSGEQKGLALKERTRRLRSLQEQQQLKR